MPRRAMRRGLTILTRLGAFGPLFFAACVLALFRLHSQTVTGALFRQTLAHGSNAGRWSLSDQR